MNGSPSSASPTLDTGRKGSVHHLALARQPAFSSVRTAEGLSNGEGFACIDRVLDRAIYGPTWIRRPAIAQFVTEALRYGDRVLKHYELHAYVVMPNHVHLLISPRVELPKIMRSLKGFTAREANRMLGRTGAPFWQREAYDHWIRDGREFEKVKVYIERNPVAAGLAATPQQYRWSSTTEENKAGDDAGSPSRLTAPRQRRSLAD